MSNKVIFVTEMYCSNFQRSSTHIMIDNIIDGFLANGYSLFLVLISDKSEEKLLQQKYSGKAKVEFVKTKMPRGKGKFNALFNMYKAKICRVLLSDKLYRKIENFIDKNTVLLSHSPSFESCYICKSILKKHKMKYIQYWSDPVTIGGILPEKYNFKRLPFYLLEKYCLSLADEIVYGTKNLMRFQKEIFKGLQNKMRFVDASYIPKNNYRIKKRDSNFSILYSGNYYSSIRNIVPLYNAMKFLDDKVKLSIYGSGDIKLQSTSNVVLHERVNSEEIKKIEAEANIIVCILNKSCIQVPGKIFYNTDLNQRILVLVDGEYGEQIQKDLEEYDRFDFCNNNTDDIVSYFLNIDVTEPYHVVSETLEKLSPKTVSKSIIEGRGS